MKKWIIRQAKMMFLTHLGRITFGGILFCIGFGMSHDGTIRMLFNMNYDPEKVDIWFKVGMAGLAILMVYTVILFAYGLVINPIRGLRERLAKRKEERSTK
jgi:hypothetical protein